MEPLSALTPKTVLFDDSHGQLFHIETTGELDLSEFYNIFINQGWAVQTNHHTITHEVLKGIDALIISGTMKPFAPAEVVAIDHFVDRGGKLAIMLHVGSPVSMVLHSLNVAVSNGVIHEVKHRIDAFDINFKVQDLMPHDLTAGIPYFNLYGGWALLPLKDQAQVVAQTSHLAWIDLNRDGKANAVQAFATVLVGWYGEGQFVVFADDAIFQNRFIKQNNYVLAENLVRWLAK